MSDLGSLAEMQALSQAVDAGQLQLNDDAADRCVRACERFLDGLRDLKRMGSNLVDVEAFGQVDSARQLGQKFSDLAVGGDGSFEQVIQGHIDVAMKMQEVFAKAGAAYRAAEESNTRGFDSIGSDL